MDPEKTLQIYDILEYVAGSISDSPLEGSSLGTMANCPSFVSSTIITAGSGSSSLPSFIAMSRSCFLYILKKHQLPHNRADAKRTCSIGVVILKASVHRDHKLPKRYIVSIVSAVVPVSVVIQAIRKSLKRNLCEVGNTR